MVNRDYSAHYVPGFSAKKIDKLTEQDTIDNLLAEISRLKKPHEKEFNQAYSFEQSGNLEEAIRTHERILANDPTYFPSLFTLAKTLCEEGRPADALDYCRRAEACEISPLLRYELKSVAFLALKQNADALFEANKYEEAIEAYDAAIQYFDANIVGVKRVRMDTAIINIIQYSHIHVKKVNARIAKTRIDEEDILLAEDDISTAYDLYAAALDIMDELDDGRMIFKKARYNIESNLANIRTFQSNINSMVKKMERRQRKESNAKILLN
jgi:tetratricopeptide (TPR) repeat protein